MRYLNKEGATIVVCSGWILEGQRDGFSDISMSNGDHFSGLFKNDKKNGVGKMTYKSGTYQVGEYEIQELEGFVIYHYHDGKTWLGPYKNGKSYGEGLEVWANGELYLKIEI